MRERPILFSGPMVRALLAGTKTQTRRVVKGERASRGLESGWYLKPYGFLNDGQFAKAASPYGQPGDRLWVREAWAQNWNQLSDTRMDRSHVYRADGGPRAQDNGTDLPWRPSIHMPRAASRITLEVTGVRVERLQDISEADAIAEGIERSGECNWRDYLDHPHNDFTGAKCSYRSLWESINGAGSWDANPWVWCVEFKML